MNRRTSVVIGCRHIEYSAVLVFTPPPMSPTLVSLETCHSRHNKQRNTTRVLSDSNIDSLTKAPISFLRREAARPIRGTLLSLRPWPASVHPEQINTFVCQPKAPTARSTNSQRFCVQRKQGGLKIALPSLAATDAGDGCVSSH